MDDPISTVDQLIAALDGPEKAAAKLGEREGTVAVWKHRKRLPARLILKHTEILAREGITASPSLWGAETETLKAGA